ncbi:MAG: ribosome silencing factor [Actinomycetota bacterium]|nr:ribosome silencing factor [Actinomycetota bacterium]MDQ3575968.1 ribosome silencing factor [Actinomycetota bacterium]
MTQEGKEVGLEEIRRLAVVAARAAAAKVGADTVVLEVGAVLAIADHFVITSAANARQVRTITEEVEAKVSESGGLKPLRIEGLDDARWVLMDYGDFVVHVFVEEVRRYYDIERLWSDAPRVEWEDDAQTRTALST